MGTRRVECGKCSLYLMSVRLDIEEAKRQIDEWKHRALLAEAHLRDAVAANEKAIVAARAEGISIGKRT